MKAQILVTKDGFTVLFLDSHGSQLDDPKDYQLSELSEFIKNQVEMGREYEVIAR